MKSLIFLFASALLIQSIASAPAAVDAPKNCEDILSASTCAKLRNLASIFHEKVGIVDEAIRAALAKHITKAQEIIDFAKKFLIDRASNFKCEDVLSAEQCTKLVALAGKFQVSVADLKRDIEEAVASGIIQGKALYEKTVEILLNKLNNLSCEQLMDAATCQKIQDFALKIHASSQDVRRAIIDAYSKGLIAANDFFNDARDYLTNEISCELVFNPNDDPTNKICTTLKDLAGRFGASFDKIMGVLRKAFANGSTNFKELYRAAVNYIINNWWGGVMLKRSVNFDEAARGMKELVEAYDEM